MSLTTRTKITSLFAGIVMVLLIVLNILIWESANTQWQSQKTQYMQEYMDSMQTLEEAKKMYIDLQVETSTGAIVYRQGMFTHDMSHTSISSWIFPDVHITQANNRYYYWVVSTKKDTYTYKIIDDITDIISTRDMIVERSLWISLFGLLGIVCIGYTFSGYVLRPIYDMNAATQRFSLSEKSTRTHVDIYGNIKDEVVILARSLEQLFSRVQGEADRLEQFSDDIAHEIKNKLFEIQSSLDIARTTGNMDIGISKAKNILKDLSHVVDALLFFARNDTGEGVHTDIGELLHSTYADTDTRISVRIVDTLEKVIYRELFLTAVGNIVGNAKKWTPVDGKIDIYIYADRVEIHDTGIGIASTDIEKIFDRMYKVDTARTSGTGHGIGLSISRKILQELHHIGLSVRSTVGVGTVFTLQWRDM